jgi:hypothetical protein
MEINTQHYKSDFRYDIEMFQQAAAEPDGENNYLLWLSRPSGTECFKERETYIREQYAHTSWTYYADRTYDTILAYAVEITGAENGRVKGNLYEFNYGEHVRQLKKDAVNAATITLKFEDALETEMPYSDFMRHTQRLQNEHGELIFYRAEPKNPDELAELLEAVRAGWRKYAPAVFRVGVRSRKG